MDPTRFDRLTTRFATRRLSRRQTLAASGAGVAAGLLATARAQDATPPATPPPVPSDPHLGADTTGTHPEFLFVQPFDRGAWAPKAGEDDTFTLTLSGAAANTVYFSDRPDRIVGLAPTQRFLDGLGFTPANPPNAALVAQTATGETEVLVIELFDPVYDAGAATLTYDAKVLADYGERGLAHLAQQQTDYELAEAFGPGSLFIDDCPDEDVHCWMSDLYGQTVEKGVLGPQGYCWSLANVTCNECADYTKLCNRTFGFCEGACTAYIQCGADHWQTASTPCIL